VCVWVCVVILRRSEYPRLYSVDVGMIVERWIWKDLEGSGCGLIEVPSRRLRGRTEEDHTIIIIIIIIIIIKRLYSVEWLDNTEWNGMDV
jgi:hypothetical protein